MTEIAQCYIQIKKEKSNLLCQRQVENRCKFTSVDGRKNIPQKPLEHLLLNHSYMNMEKVAKLILSILTRLLELALAHWGLNI